MLSQRSAILVQNAAGLGLMLRAASGRTQHKPETRSNLYSPDPSCPWHACLATRVVESLQETQKP